MSICGNQECGVRLLYIGQQENVLRNEKVMDIKGDSEESGNGSVLRCFEQLYPESTRSLELNLPVLTRKHLAALK